MARHNMKRMVICTLMVVFTFAGIQSQVYAGMIGTDQLTTEVNVEMQRSELNTLLAREDVAKQLTAFGVDAQDAQQRVASLSDTEVNSLHNQVSNLPAGSGALGTIALVLVILILLDVAGVTDIFPRV